jgi:hypothetical protein
MRPRLALLLVVLTSTPVSWPGFTYPYQAESHKPEASRTGPQQGDFEVAKPDTFGKKKDASPNAAPNAAETQDESKSKPNWPISSEGAMVALTLVYVLLTGVYAGVSIFTLRAIKRQVEIAERAADAAKANADVLMQAHRAQIQVRMSDPVPTLTIGQIPVIRANLINTGLTPAYDLRYETWTEILPKLFADFTSRASHDKVGHPNTVYPNAPDPSVILATLDSALTQAELAALQNAINLLCIRIRVTYKDAFAASRWQNFGFFAAGRLGAGYLPKYNDSIWHPRPN